MNRKISLFLATVCLQWLIGDIHANAATSPQKTVQFYAGLSGGIEQMSGRQSESLTAPPMVAGESKTYSTNLPFPSSDKGTVISGMAGFMWDMPIAPFSIGPEFYIGQGSRNSNFRVAYYERLAGEDRVYSSTIKRTSFYGILLRAGYTFCQDYLAYFSLGADFSNFSIERSLQKDAGIPDSNTSTVRTNKNFSGFLFGIGLEKKMGSYKMGVEFKGVRYGKKYLSDLIPTTNGLVGQTSLSYAVQPRIYSLSIRLTYLF